MRKSISFMDRSHKDHGYPAADRLDKRKFLTGCAALTAIGFILAVVGIACGGMVTGIRLNGKGFQVTAPSLNKNDSTKNKGEKTLEPFDSIEVILDYADIQISSIASGTASGIKASDPDGYAIAYCVDKDIDFKYELRDRKLTIRQERPFSMFTNDFSWFSFGNDRTDNEQEYVTVYVPHDAKLSEITVNADSGNLACNGIQTENLMIRADYGDVKIQDIYAGSLDAAVESGSLTFSQAKGNDYTIESDYGDITMDGVSLTGDLKLDLESGDVKCQDVSVQDFYLDSSYGDFSGKQIAFRNVQATMESGDCRLQDATFDNWEMEMEYGNVHLITARPLKEYAYNLRTEYGRITIDGNDMGESYSSLFQEDRPEHMIKIDCESGDIRIE